MLARLIRPTTAATCRLRRSRRIRQSTSDATLARLIRPTTVATCRLDKAFTPHPAIQVYSARKSSSSEFKNSFPCSVICQ
ncbi:mannitol-1-phosphate 5-dehydrogenase [Escherichia coli O128:H2 str. 2011C-3317]|nr:mannitol-1-phosphate 5-dehydrogenase [Escherichia coli O128:H2 str. 2011C-3317]